MSHLENAIEQAKSLTADERRQLIQVLESFPNARQPDSRLEEALLARGHQMSGRRSNGSSHPWSEKDLVQVRGKSISETIIEERR
jgi:hypothetical protein